MDLARTLVIPFIGAAILVSIVELICYLIGGHNPAVQVAIILTATLLTYAGLFLHERYRPFQEA